MQEGQEIGIWRMRMQGYANSPIGISHRGRVITLWLGILKGKYGGTSLMYHHVVHVYMMYVANLP